MAEKVVDHVSTSSPQLSARTPIEEQHIVGFDDQALAIKNRLGGSRTQLEVVSIVGMAGIGKTTLARKVYDDPWIVNHFEFRGWTTVSHVYPRRNLLLGILSSSQVQLTSNMYKMSDERLTDELHKCLKRKRYLIVMDDVWNIEAWNDMRMCFPNDNKRSRIIFTSRFNDVALRAKLDKGPHLMHFLSESESWDLLQEKVFQSKTSCPSGFLEVGKQIARKCQGLPLSIVVIGGLLAKSEKTLGLWEQVAQVISSYIVSDPEQCIDTLALSYYHLPDHLKPCFLYFGAFPEDLEIPVSKLIWLWIAEGFIQRKENKSLEDVGEEYLVDLIQRSLILIVDRRSNGEIKSCRIHDILHDLSRRKAKEENFLERIYRYGQVSSSSSSSSSHIVLKGRRLCIYMPLLDYISSNPCAIDVHSFLCFASNWDDEFPLRCPPFIYEVLKTVRVLDLSRIRLELFPDKIEGLVHLRYLALRVDTNEIPALVSTLTNLETLIVKGRKGTISLPFDIWNMTKLRHLDVRESSYLPCRDMLDSKRHKPVFGIRYIPQQCNFRLCDICKWKGYNSQPSLLLEDLQTISTLTSEHHSWLLLKNTPNLSKLRCIIIYGDWPLDFLTKLETLKMLYHGTPKATPLPKLPLSLKKISLDKFRLPWSEISKLGRLPNLEVLTLRNNAFDGPTWDPIDEEFLQLKFLKLDTLNIVNWNASKDHFPILERLVLIRCRHLEEIPSSLGDISTLQMIEVRWCSKAPKSARQIEDDQLEAGNEKLKILVHPPVL